MPSRQLYDYCTFLFHSIIQTPKERVSVRNFLEILSFYNSKKTINKLLYKKNFNKRPCILNLEIIIIQNNKDEISNELKKQIGNIVG